jgi:Fuc2NAc and GlcNAc transferase
MLVLSLSVMITSTVISKLLTGGAVSVAQRIGMMDIPNARSSHSVPTPRGGGIAILLAVSAVCAGATVAGAMDPRLLGAFLPGGLAVGTVGWLDDRRGLSPQTRAVVHVAAAIWAVMWLGGLPAVRVGSDMYSVGIAGSVLAVVGIVWFVNLFNFMDGVDGIASMESVVVSACAGAIALLAGNGELSLAYAAVGGASAGFLFWNWPPARIFLGDVGSGYLGYTLAVLAIAGEQTGSVPLIMWIVLVSAFGFDATVTLIRRLFRGEPIFTAHRSHAYQRAVASGLSHKAVTLGTAVLTCVLGVFAITAALYSLNIGVLVLCAFVLLSAVYIVVELRLPMFVSRSTAARER